MAATLHSTRFRAVYDASRAVSAIIANGFHSLPRSRSAGYWRGVLPPGDVKTRLDRGSALFGSSRPRRNRLQIWCSLRRLLGAPRFHALAFVRGIISHTCRSCGVSQLHDRSRLLLPLGLSFSRHRQPRTPRRDDRRRPRCRILVPARELPLFSLVAPDPRLADRHLSLFLCARAVRLAIRNRIHLAAVRRADSSGLAGSANSRTRSRQRHEPLTKSRRRSTGKG